MCALCARPFLVVCATEKCSIHPTPYHSPGAGKSTTINMLTGLTLPTSGTASLHGRDLRTELASVRSQLGYCPQHDVLFPTLSVSGMYMCVVYMHGNCTRPSNKQ